MILVVLILTIACANLANLQLARAVARTREVAVRVAIGASQGRLVRQSLTESFVLSLFGAIAGFLLARACLRLLVTTLPAMRDLDVHLDARVLLFCGGVAAATALVFGLAPVWMMRRVDVAATLKDETVSMGATVRGGWVRQALVVAQIALTIVLVFGANLFVYTLRNLRGTDTGLQTEHVLQLTVNGGRGAATAGQRGALFDRMLDDVRKVPGVRAAAFSADELLSGRASRMDIYPPEYQRVPNEDLFSVGMTVDAGFFRTLGIPLLQGRDFTSQDTPSSPNVVVLNQAAADFLFKSTNPLGRHVGIGGKPDFTVIGVVGNTKFRNLREPMSRIVYFPLLQNAGAAARTLYVRTDSDPIGLTGSLRHAILAPAHDALIDRVRRFSEQIDDSLAQERATAWLSTFFGLLALTIAALGLYGLMAYTVSRRTREIGVRTALGASPENVVRMVFGQSMTIAGTGAVLGIIVAIALGQMLDSMLYGVTARDPLAILTSAATLLITAAVASYLPARRAAAIDPLKALRDER
jgi:predicted permease